MAEKNALGGEEYFLRCMKCGNPVGLTKQLAEWDKYYGYDCDCGEGVIFIYCEHCEKQGIRSGFTLYLEFDSVLMTDSDKPYREVIKINSKESYNERYWPHLGMTVRTYSNGPVEVLFDHWDDDSIMFNPNNAENLQDAFKRVALIVRSTTLKKVVDTAMFLGKENEKED